MLTAQEYVETKQRADIAAKAFREDRERAEMYARLSRPGSSRPSPEAQAAFDAAGRGIVLIGILLIRYAPALIGLGAIVYSVEGLVHAPHLQDWFSKTNEFVASWVTSWGIPDLALVRFLLASLVTGTFLVVAGAYLPAMLVYKSIGPGQLHGVSYGLAIAAIIATGVISLIVAYVAAAIATGLLFSTLMWPVATAMHKARGEKHLSYAGWVMSIASIWAFPGTLRGWAAARDPAFFGGDR